MTTTASREHTDSIHAIRHMLNAGLGPDDTGFAYRHIAATDMTAFYYKAEDGREYQNAEEGYMEPVDALMECVTALHSKEVHSNPEHHLAQLWSHLEECECDALT